MGRYDRHIILKEVGQEGQLKLSGAKVLVVGAGGLGCPILQYLTAAGIGTLGIIDFDIVEVSNLHRQILFKTSDIGINKALAAKKQLQDLNPTITIEAYPERLTSKNALQLCAAYDVVVDGTDNFVTRYLINDAVVKTGKPLVYGAIFKFEGQLSVFNYQNGPSYRCLFPKPPKKGVIPNCNEVGVLGVLTGIIGTMMANEVIKIILKFSDVLSGVLLCYDSRTTKMSKLKINRNQSEIDHIINQTELQEIQENTQCEPLIDEITELNNLILSQIEFIDVREKHEKPKITSLNYKQVPLSQIKEHLDIINSNKKIVVFCQSGIRSKKAVELLKDCGINNAVSFKGGVMNMITSLKNIKNET